MKQGVSLILEHGVEQKTKQIFTSNTNNNILETPACTVCCVGKATISTDMIEEVGISTRQLSKQGRLKAL